MKDNVQQMQRNYIATDGLATLAAMVSCLDIGLAFLEYYRSHYKNKDKTHAFSWHFRINIPNDI